VVGSNWDSLKIQGNDIWVLKEKLKSSLRLWNKSTFGDINIIKENFVSKLGYLDYMILRGEIEKKY